MEEVSLSIEETNKLRIAAGLKPLKVEEDDTAEEKAQRNFKELQDEQTQKQQEQSIKDRIEKSKNRRERFAKLEGKGLGEADDSNIDDTHAFAKRLENLKTAKQSKPKKVRAQLESYNAISQDLNVRHDLNDFSEGQEVILTLADKNVLDEDEDQLVNVELEEKERIQRNLDNKKGKALYNSYDDEEFLLGNNSGKKRNILSKYDEPLDGFTTKKGFKLNSDPASVLASLTQDSEDIFRPKGKAQSLNEIDKNEVADYYSKEEAQVTFKKLKKKKSKSKPKNKRDHDSEGEEDLPYIIPLDNYVDDDDLQQSLSKSRKKAIKKFKFSEESLAEKVSKNSDFDIQEYDGGLVLSATSEFVNNLQFSTNETTTKSTPAEFKKLESSVASSPETTNTTMSQEPSTKEKSPSPEPIATANFIEEEPLISKGLGATLDFLTKRGLYQKPTLEQIKKDDLSKKREKWALEQRKVDKLKELDGYDERGSSRERHSSRDRDTSRDRRSNPDRHLMEEQVNMMKDYQPSFKLEYKDAAGNALNPKEAYRQLSHRFHGKSSGFKKTEKRLKHQEDQKKLESMSISGAQSGLAEALAKKQKETGQAHFILKDSK